ncbi:MAG: APC family permease [Caldilineaceae bacterium]|nr:APC family permease [Caldilineaceae bacterium]
MSQRIVPSENDEDRPGLHRVAHKLPNRRWRTWLIGRPLATADAEDQTIGKTVGLAVFASDALSSTAYATQEILIILAMAGAAAFGFAFPISIAIVVLMAIVTISYRQTIYAYPNGGGAYIVARDNLGELPAQIAGAALLTDYVLTVAVSMSSGVAQLVSAFPLLSDFRVHTAVVLVLIIMVLNLRGVKEAGIAFAIPSYIFVATMLMTVGTGLVRWLAGGLGTVVEPPHLEIVQTLPVVSLFLILHAFSSGTAALTGIEAISNGVTAFREPRSRNAAITLVWMAVILATLFLGITFLAGQIDAIPSEDETVISQLARTVYGGRNLLYLITIGATTLILIMAANTAFAGFPRLSAMQAADGYLPRQLTYRGSRLVYSRGIVALALLACLLIVIFQASVTALIPLYAIGVFLSFSLSQAGMARRWWKIGHLAPGTELVERGSTLRYEAGWKPKMIINSFGAFCTAVVMVIFAVTKFRTGAWIVLIVVPVLVIIFELIHRHYKHLAERLSLSEFRAPRRIRRHRVVMPVGGVHQGTMVALEYARSLSDDVTAVYVAIDPEQEAAFRRKWSAWGSSTRLVVLESPYRTLLEPLLEYIEEVASTQSTDEVLTVVVPRFVPRRWWQHLLHTQTAVWLRLALMFHPGVVITDIPYLEAEDALKEG